MALVPVVDIADPDATSRADLDRAGRDHGFFLVRGHGLDAVVDRTWEATREFFDAPRPVRTAIARDEANPLGWYDRELTKRRRDHKEVFDFVDPQVGEAMNRWPDLPGFRTAMTDHFEAMTDLADRVLALLHDVLDFGPASRDAFALARRSSTVRCNRYTVGDPVPASERTGLADLGDVALGHHTDPGTLTLLLQDDTGGLQTHSAEHGWIDVSPEPGTIVCNLGDCAQAWTNDRWRAAVHRVLPMTAQVRHSVPYFGNPPRETVVAPLPECVDGAPRYRAFPWREFMAARAADNFRDLGVDDTQVGDYRL